MPTDKRYSRILSAAKYYSAIDNYIKYITDASKRGSKVGSGKPRQESIKLYIDPFNIKLAAGQVALASAAKPSWTTYDGNLGTHTTATKPTNEDLIIKLQNFSAARVNITKGRSASGVPKTSKVTGLKYLDYGGTSTSIPFGRKNETETQEAAFLEIKTAILASTAGAIITLKPEQF